jgi:hypothetical protein
MNRVQLTIVIELPPTESPASEGFEAGELARNLPAVRAAVDSIPDAVLTDASLEIIEPATDPEQVRFNELAL